MTRSQILAVLRAAIAADPRPRVCCCGDLGKDALWSPWAAGADVGRVSSSFYDGVEAGWDGLPEDRCDAKDRPAFLRGHAVGSRLRAEFHPRCGRRGETHRREWHSHQSRAEWARWNG